MFPQGRLWHSSIVMDYSDERNPKIVGFKEGTPDYIIQQYYEDQETCKMI